MNEIDRLALRVGALERQSRRLRRGGLAGALLVAAAALAGAAPSARVPDVLAAHAFELVASDGRVLGRWRAAGADTMSFDVTSAGEEVSRMELSAGAPFVVVYDRSGEQVRAEKPAAAAAEQASDEESPGRSFIKWGDPSTRGAKRAESENGAKTAAPEEEDDAFDWVD